MEVVITNRRKRETRTPVVVPRLVERATRDSETFVTVDDDEPPAMDLDAGSTVEATYLESVSPTAIESPQGRSVKEEPDDEADVVEILRERSVSHKSPATVPLQFKKDRAFDVATIRSRLQGLTQYPIDFDPALMQVTVSRRFMSSVYGGSSQAAFPKIGEKKLAVHGLRNFMYLILDLHPHAPHQPGHPGLWFLQEVLTWEWSRKTERRTFVRVSPGKWLYVGQYKLNPVAPFSREEWLMQSNKIRSFWCRDILEFDWGKSVRARIIYRRDKGREATDRELDRIMESKTRHYRHVTEAEIMQAFDEGKEMLGVFAMKCVGYDKDFQRSLAGTFPTWVPPPKEPKRTKKTRRTKVTKSARKRKGQSRVIVVDSDTESDEDEEPEDMEEDD
ncbi:hypothetical protein BV25DRAFT_1889909 [Artomyces pyxidatus]|uniref:Uncharacterized protein n=1 Tax=Artomyces pyxidatus TaxID=48021 RepID=A0ACB8ST78_9AGAM|nr:hypothetical protein BV25DRAFT_1889909 [Artomyces pyxidatus]